MFSNLLHGGSWYTNYYAQSQIPTKDIEESFVKGSGPGGQKVNKSSNCVILKHKPTGIVIKCHQSRSQYHNRIIARQLLKDKIEASQNCSNNSQEKKFLKQKRKKMTSKIRSKRKLEILKDNKAID
ncbi:uncharacterized protein TRIADDRAFT_28629 [Trichoplax adhaerens]|uniref:Prokaryotic-type class I peptide chain release factors domain-containing protein n=1 Tax=Trichoplax adhaerens TaxID=10228 RepID=B3S4M4_TRIAD|nr:hypothetical protein TRIADDRAFT_28629 [Trichoplax adhaerens]EDV22657.1 hypothetical protein TRIADDRAFT_28629 [Trichoplax adhaerens]|eukprot:XP_002115201.1 hypothetical protein TRIADDRAFT_28629 [Trichoplax adhaerens]